MSSSAASSGDFEGELKALCDHQAPTAGLETACFLQSEKALKALQTHLRDFATDLAVCIAFNIALGRRAEKNEWCVTVQNWHSEGIQQQHHEGNNMRSGSSHG
jgi:hypothetical protein